MAIFTPGSLITGVRGTVGGSMFSANGSGPYVRPWSRSSNPRTERQSTNRARFSDWASAWNALTSGQRSGWDTYAAAPAQELTNSLGDAYYVSGFNWFVRINQHQIGAGATQQSTAPTLTRPAAPSLNGMIFRATGGADSFVQISGADPTLSLLKALYVIVVPSTSRQSVSQNRPWMATKLVTFTVRVEFQTEVEAKYGIIQIGHRAFCTLQNQDSEGQRSAPVTIASNAVA